MIKQYRYEIGGFSGDQLQAVVNALLNEAEGRPNGHVALLEVVEELHLRLGVAIRERLPKFDAEDVCRCWHAFDWHAPSGPCTGSQCQCGSFKVRANA